jgi:hypothetical protein
MSDAMNDERVCLDCGSKFSLPENFAQTSQSNQSKTSRRCRSCIRRRDHESYARHREARVEGARAYSQRPEAKALRDKRHESSINKYPEKESARRLVRNAVSTGKIIKPKVCQGCNKEELKHKLHAHHEDYSKPLDVVWLCFGCHRKVHGKNYYGK